MPENIYFLSAIERFNNGQFEAAIPFFDRSLQHDPAHVQSLYRRGLCFLKTGQFPKALADFDQAVALSPSDAQHYGERAVAYHHLGRPAEAMRDLDKAVALDPGNPYRYSSRAFIRAHIGQVHEAIADYQQAIALDPEDDISLNNLGLLEERLGRMEAAKKHFQRADEIAGRQGTTFPKPELDELLANHRKEREKADAAKIELQQRIKTQHDQVSKNTDKPSTASIVRQVFTSKTVFMEFLAFLKNGLRLKP